MKKLFFVSVLILSFVTSFAGPVQPAKPCYDDAVIPSYARCFYVTFVAVCCDGKTRTGHLGSTCNVGTPNEQGLKNHIAMQIGCIPNNVQLKYISAISNADYKSFFKGSYGKVRVELVINAGVKIKID